MRLVRVEAFLAEDPRSWCEGRIWYTDVMFDGEFIPDDVYGYLVLGGAYEMGRSLRATRLLNLVYFEVW